MSTPNLDAAGAAAAGHTSERAPSSSRAALLSLSLSILLSSLGTSIANVGLPTLADAFAASFQQVQWVVLAYLLAVTTSIVGIGRLGDLVGRRRLLLAGIGVFTLASGACGLAPDLPLLIAARALQGLGAAAMMALAMACVSETVPAMRIGRAMGLLGTTSAIGTALGPSLGGVLIAACGWPAIFLINLPFGILAWLLVRRHLPVERTARGVRRIGFDPPGTVLLAVTLAAYALAMTSGRGHFGTTNMVLLAAAFAGALLFVFVESRAAAPLVRLAQLRDPVLSVGLVASALVATVIMATMVVGPFYLSHALGLDARAVGLVLSAGPLVSALGGVPAGRLVDRLGAQRMSLVGLAVMAIGAGALSVLPLASGRAGYIAALVVLTVGYASFQAANNTSVMAGVAADRRGVVSGLLNLSRNLGLVTGASVMGAVFAFAAGDVAAASPAAVAAGLHATFAVAATLIVTALGVALASRTRIARQRAEAAA